MPFVTAAGHSLEYDWIEGGEPTLVFLHEGLGSIRQWRDFPARVAAATGCRALVYNRYGYGNSDVLAERCVTVRSRSSKSNRPYL
jgi:pimeloyl-ACP methyl ester carboxylesterase